MDWQDFTDGLRTREFDEIPRCILDAPKNDADNLNVWVDLGIATSKRTGGRISLWLDFRKWRPRPLRTTDGPSINDLATHRWYEPAFTPEEESPAIRWVRDGGPLAFRNLLARFHGQVLKTAAARMPRYWRSRRGGKQDKHTNALLYEDLVAAGVGALWEAALVFDADRGWKFWTAAKLPIGGAIADEARRQRRNTSTETRLERWLYSHPHASPEQAMRQQERLNLKQPIFRSFAEAAEVIRRFREWHPRGGNLDTTGAEQMHGPVDADFRQAYSFFHRNSLSPQLAPHEFWSAAVDRLAGVYDYGDVDVGNAKRPKSPRDLSDYTESRVIRFKGGDRRQVACQIGGIPRTIPVTPDLEAKAFADCAEANAHWKRLNNRWPAGRTYKRWSIAGGVGRPEHQNLAITPRLVALRGDKWTVEVRGSTELLSVLESPSRHCLKPKPCEICNRKATSGPCRDYVVRQSIWLSATQGISKRTLDQGEIECQKKLATGCGA